MLSILSGANDPAMCRQASRRVNGKPRDRVWRPDRIERFGRTLGSNRTVGICIRRTRIEGIAALFPVNPRDFNVRHALSTPW